MFLLVGGAAQSTMCLRARHKSISVNNVYNEMNDLASRANIVDAMTYKKQEEGKASFMTRGNDSVSTSRSPAAVTLCPGDAYLQNPNTTLADLGIDDGSELTLATMSREPEQVPKAKTKTYRTAPPINESKLLMPYAAYGNRRHDDSSSSSSSSSSYSSASSTDEDVPIARLPFKNHVPQVVQMQVPSAPQMIPAQQMFTSQQVVQTPQVVQSPQVVSMQPQVVTPQVVPSIHMMDFKQMESYNYYQIPNQKIGKSKWNKKKRKRNSRHKKKSKKKSKKM